MDFRDAARILRARTAGSAVWSRAMDWFIRQQNIERYRRLLAQPADEEQRLQLLKLLAEEEAKDRPPVRDKASDAA